MGGNELTRTAVKLLAAGATIAAIAFAVMTLSPGGDVPETRADVVDFDFFETTPSVRFASALRQLGHEPPRVYRIGQEEVYFSARSTSRKPANLVEEYQRQFVAHGVNSASHLEPVSPFTRDARDMLRGEVMTFAADGRFMAMGGGVIAGLPETTAELEVELDSRRSTAFKDVFKGFRSIQAEQYGDVTVVTAVWSHDTFDIERAVDPGPGSMDVPACPGCRAMPTFDTLANDVNRTIFHFESTQSSREVQKFYRRALTDRGWVESPASRYVGSGPAEYVRDNERLLVDTRDHESGTSATLIRGD